MCPPHTFKAYLTNTYPNASVQKNIQQLTVYVDKFPHGAVHPPDPKQWQQQLPCFPSSFTLALERSSPVCARISSSLPPLGSKNFQRCGLQRSENMASEACCVEAQLCAELKLSSLLLWSCSRSPRARKANVRLNACACAQVLA